MIKLFLKQPTDYNPNFFRIVRVQDWSKTSPANTVQPLGTPIFSNVKDIDNFLVKNSKIKTAF